MKISRLVLVVPLGAAGTALAPYFSASVAAHVVFFAFLVLAPTMRGRRAPLEDALVVELAGNLPAATVEPSQSVAPPATAKPSPEVVRPESRPVVLPDPTRKKERKEKDKERPKPKAPPQEPAPAAAGAADAPATPAAPGAGAPKAAGGTISLDAGDVEFAWYRALVASSLKSHWMRPVLEATSGTLVATVSFEIRRDGTVQNVRVETSSGVPAMDRSVLRAVADSSPLPPLPRSWQEPALRVIPSFQFSPGEN